MHHGNYYQGKLGLKHRPKQTSTGPDIKAGGLVHPKDNTSRQKVSNVYASINQSINQNTLFFPGWNRFITDAPFACWSGGAKYMRSKYIKKEYIQ